MSCHLRRGRDIAIARHLARQASELELGPYTLPVAKFAELNYLPLHGQSVFGISFRSASAGKLVTWPAQLFQSVVFGTAVWDDLSTARSVWPRQLTPSLAIPGWKTGIAGPK